MVGGFFRMGRFAECPAKATLSLVLHQHTESPTTGDRAVSPGASLGASGALCRIRAGLMGRHRA